MVKIPEDIKRQIYTPEVRRKMSDKRKEYFANLSAEQKSELRAKISRGKLKQNSDKKDEIRQLHDELAKYKAMFNTLFNEE